MSPIIEARQISKVFPARRGPRDLRGRGGIGDWFSGRRPPLFTALQDISLAVEPGESLGVIGRNGSGKSTLLSILAGITLPTSGRVIVRGRIASLLELGAGFSPVLTGRENIYLNAGLMGMRHAQVSAVFDDIVAFSGIGAFIDQPVETYSSGMYVRIGFSIAVHTNPDIFIADEVLAVGDADFQRKCRKKIGELREQGKTIIFVSHDLGSVNTLCDRVILLDKGRMIQRDTPHKTITYYLRQVGMEESIHTFHDGALEVIQCHGRVSVFQNEEEISAPPGFHMQFFSLGQEHSSEEAAWQVVERRPNGCVVEGRMLRLPIRLLWELTLEANRLLWRIALDCEQDTALNEILVNLYLPTAYTRWAYSDLTGTFPEITPSDVKWTVLVAPEGKATKAAALPEADASLPPIVFQMTPCNAYFGFLWANSEYMAFSRVLSATARFPEHDNIFAAGRHELLELALDASVPEDQVMEQVCSENTLHCGRLTARFEQGQIRLRWDETEITTDLHLYASILINHLWNDSQGLQWHGVNAIQDGIRIRGESRRFPYGVEWNLERREHAFHLRIWLEPTETIALQEHHTTLVLPDAYHYWATDHECNTFPEHVPRRIHWSHCNLNYAAGKHIVAYGESMPTVCMTADDDCPPVRMTAINTSYQEHTRALQALRVPEPGERLLAPGRHLYFSGVIAVRENK